MIPILYSAGLSEHAEPNVMPCEDCLESPSPWPLGAVWPGGVRWEGEAPNDGDGDGGCGCPGSGIFICSQDLNPWAWDPYTDLVCRDP